MLKFQQDTSHIGGPRASTTLDSTHPV